jgi:hypothetical protein
MTVVEFAAPSSLSRETTRLSDLRIVGNGPPGTFVILPHGVKISLPTDQIVAADDADGQARVEFGGMRFVGFEDGWLIFVRVRELWPDDQLSPARSHRMMLDPAWVAAVLVDGRPAWRA